VDLQLQSFISDVIPIVDVLVVPHREDDPPSHGSDVDTFRTEVAFVDGDMSENDGGESLDGFLGKGATLANGLASDLDSASDVVEGLLSREDLRSIRTSVRS
jgi:hypothetical protein